MNSYFKCCGMCIYMNLYDKYGATFKCERSGHYYKPDDKCCKYFEPDSKKTTYDIDLAKEGKYSSY